MSNFNPQNPGEYGKILGAAKLQALWKEYLSAAAAAWAQIPEAKTDELRIFFHRWRSSSLVFGMEDFAAICAQIEEAILSHHFNKVPDLVAKSKICFDNGVKAVETYLSKLEI